MPILARFRKRRRLVLIGVLGLIVAAGGIGLLLGGGWRGLANAVLRRPANEALIRWFDDPASRAELATSFEAPCPGYPFLVPSSGLVGGLPWGAASAPYTILNPHPGIDIFGAGGLGTVPVVAAYDGLLTREPDWVSSVIIRHDDPLHPGETIWTYYTHMANLSGSESYIVANFPPGTVDAPVRQGDLLGYQGVYNGGVDAARVGLHLHFSVVKSDPLGDYTNETVFENTLDPTPYLGLALNDSPTEAFPLGCMEPAAIGS